SAHSRFGHGRVAPPAEDWRKLTAGMADGAGGGQRRRRLESIAAPRGIVMILMALDHVRDYVGVPANPTDPATASVALFFTRWVTHLCAPTFFLLTGVGAWLRGNMGGNARTVPREYKGANPGTVPR